MNESSMQQHYMYKWCMLILVVFVLYEWFGRNEWVILFGFLRVSQMLLLLQLQLHQFICIQTNIIWFICLFVYFYSFFVWSRERQICRQQKINKIVNICMGQISLCEFVTIRITKQWQLHGMHNAQCRLTKETRIKKKHEHSHIIKSLGEEQQPQLTNFDRMILHDDFIIIDHSQKNLLMILKWNLI